MVFIINKTEKKVELLFNKISLIDMGDVKKTICRFCKKWARLIYVIQWGEKEIIKNKELESLTYNNYVETLIISATTMTHLIIAYIVLFPFNYKLFILITVIVLVFILQLIFLPFGKSFTKYIIKSMAYEYNNYVIKHKQIVPLKG